MRLRLKLWPLSRMPRITAMATIGEKTGGLARQFFSWQGLGAAVLGVMLAKWTWVLLASASTAMPAADWETSGEAGQVFGTASMADTPAIATLGDIKLVGVFAHPTKGFAVMQVDEKQIGLGLGDEVKPGVKLVETDANYVMLERAGVRQRVDLTGAAATGATGPAPSYVAPVPVPVAPTYAPPAPGDSNSSLSAGHSGYSTHAGLPPGMNALLDKVPGGQREAYKRRLESMANMPPEQREAMQRKIEMMEKNHH